MKFTVNKDILKKSLDAIKGGLGGKRKSDNPLQRTYLIYASKGSIHVNTYDLSTQMSVVIELPEGAIEKEGKGLINSDDLDNVVKVGKKNDDIIIEANNTNQWSIDVGGTAYNISGMNPSEAVVFDQFKIENSIVMESIDLKGRMESIAPVMAKTDVRYFLNGMLFDIQKDTITLVATDGHRLACNSVEFTGNVESHQIIVPYSAVHEIIKMLKSIDTITLGFNGAYLTTTVGNVAFKTKLINGKFPDYKRVIPPSREDDITMVADRIDLISSLEKFDGLGFRDAHAYMRADFDGAGVLFYGKSERSEYKEQFTLKESNKKEPFRTAFNNAYLRSALSLFTDQNVTMRMAQETSSMKITSDLNDGLIHLVMPMRV